MELTYIIFLWPVRHFAKKITLLNEVKYAKYAKESMFK